jgi:hypothetical protein
MVHVFRMSGRAPVGGQGAEDEHQQLCELVDNGVVLAFVDM